MKNLTKLVRRKTIFDVDNEDHTNSERWHWHSCSIEGKLGEGLGMYIVFRIVFKTCRQHVYRPMKAKPETDHSRLWAWLLRMTDENRRLIYIAVHCVKFRSTRKQRWIYWCLFHIYFIYLFQFCFATSSVKTTQMNFQYSRQKSTKQ